MSPNPSKRPSRQLDSAAQIRLVPYSPPRISSAGSAQTSSSTFSSAQHPQPDIDSVSPHHLDEALPKPDVSGQLRRTTSSITTASGLLPLSPDSDNASISSRASSSGGTPSARRPKRVISVNSDSKTFSLVPLSGSAASRTDSFASHGFSSSTPSGSWGRVSSSVYILEDRESSPATPGPADMSLSSNSSVPLNETTASRNNRLPSSAWSWRMRGATMPKIDDKQSQSSQDDDCSLHARSDEDEYDRRNLEKSPSLPPMPAIFPSRRNDTERVIDSKPSFQSIASNSTLSERTNYKVYGQSSPSPANQRISYEYEQRGDEFPDDDASFAPSSQQSVSNYHVLADSSDVGSIHEQKRPYTASSDANVIVHRRSVSCSSLISSRNPLRSEFSQESLLVAPLRPTKRHSFENGSVVKACSGESLRRASLSSIGTSFSQEATRSLFIGAASVVYIQGGLRKQKSRRDQLGSSSSNVMAPHPHRWSAPLSTVMSESERGSLAPSRSLSPWSGTDRRSSNNSRHVLSMSSSLAGLDDLMTPVPTHSRSASLEHPPVALHTRNSGRDLAGNMRRIRDYDEHGDGLADLDVLHHRASRSRLASEHALRHSASTRSLNPLSFPAWARLYYCSGERRFLLAQASSDSIRSLYNGSLYNDQPPPGKAFLNHAPSLERMHSNPALRPSRAASLSIGVSVHPEKNQTETAPQVAPQANTSEFGHSDEETPSRVTSIVHRVKKKTSSIWSPHLHRDRRASRYSIWEPPSGPSEERGFDWPRNRQTIMFIVGFILPVSWIVAAFLPLPPKPILEMTERHHNSTSHLDLGSDNNSSQATHTVDETRYNTARWWRNLNRVMAIVGLLVIGAVIALIIVGVKQQWTRRS